MLIHGLLEALRSAARVLFGNSVRDVLLDIIFRLNSQDGKRATPRLKPLPSKYIIVDDDCDAASEFDFYYDERYWFEETDGRD